MERFRVKSFVFDKLKHIVSLSVFSADADQRHLARVLYVVIIANFSLTLFCGVVIVLTAGQKLDGAIAVIATLVLPTLSLVLIFMLLASTHRALLAALRSAKEQLAAHQTVAQILRESEARFRLIASVTSDYTFSSSFNAQRELEHTLFTGAFEAVSGYTPEEFAVVGGWRAILHPEDLAQNERDMATLRENKSTVIELRFLKKNGEVRWMRMYRVPLWDAEHKQLVGIVGAAQDITEHKRAEFDLKQKEERYRGAITAAGLVPYVVNYAEKRFTFIGEDIVKLTGYTAQEINPRLLRESIQEEYVWKTPANLAPDEVRRLVISGVPLEWHNDYRMRTQNGESAWLSDTSVPVVDEHGKAIGAIGIMQDITERKKIEQTLQDLNQLKTEFLSTAAHELRTPLTSILGFSELLTSRAIEANRSQRYIQLIHEQSLQLKKIIDGLLDIARLESKQGLALEMQPINLNDLVTKTLTPIAETSPQCQFKIEGLATCPTVVGDPFRLNQVLQNLLSNAVKYSPEGGTITVRGRVIPGFVEVSIQDEGIGMTADQQIHLFEPFYRADASNITISGTGLGLAISKLIVELHGGQIWAESEYGVGTVGHFTLPHPGA